MAKDLRPFSVVDNSGFGATTVLCDESRPTVSLIVPLKHMIEQSMAQCDEDSSTIAQMKRAILKDFTDRYQGSKTSFCKRALRWTPGSGACTS
ncbi:hypothetical protein F7725_012077 [Dissostichus mawsoni]|uniref:Uncharacterized protein n=1 Tax=Dissostichus mawsoni TaxID=36200 RepID=A0A7J5ZAX9_DISMA|nr:hypothetical protein F7725_012077 [Dissostichus mawsoni]